VIKTKPSADIDNPVQIAHLKKSALTSFKEALGFVSELCLIDRREAFSVLAIMQSFTVGYIVVNSGDRDTLNAIIDEDEEMIRKYEKE
jgi:uncharacterized protein (DUF1786 family)